LIDLIRDSVKRFDTVATEQTIEINGINHVCIGRDHSSAKLLFNILSLSISPGQIAHLKQDILANGILSRILLDPDYELKFSTGVGLFYDRVKGFAEFFRNYFDDTVLRFASALLLFESDITPDVIANFGHKYNDDVNTLARTELSLESVLPVQSKVQNLTDVYHNGVDYLDPWISLPDYDKIVKPILVSADFRKNVDHLSSSFVSQVRSLTLPGFEVMGSSILAASRDFTHDYNFLQVQEFASAYKKTMNDKCPVYVVGNNRRTPFQMLANHVARLHCCRIDSTFFDFVKRESTDAVVYYDKGQFSRALQTNTSKAVVVIDTCSHDEIKTRTTTYILPDLEAGDGSIVRCFNILNGLFSKPKGITPDEYHKRIPLVISLKFVPTFGDDAQYVQPIMNNMIHHYDVRYLPPVDLTGIEFGIHMVKRTSMLPKQHDNTRSPYKVFQSYVHHVLSTRYLLINGIIANRYYWKCLAPMRIFSRYYGIGSKMKIRVQDLVDFSDWGDTQVVNDVNNVFAEYITPSVFTRPVFHTYHKKVQRDHRRKPLSSLGVSHLVSQSKRALDFIVSKETILYGPTPLADEPIDTSPCRRPKKQTFSPPPPIVPPCVDGNGVEPLSKGKSKMSRRK